MENLLQIDPEINVLYTINEPTARGAVQAMNSFGISTDDVTIVSVDGGCAAMGDIDDGIINATSMQFPSRMAELGVEWGIRNALTGEVPSPEDSEYYIEGNEIFNTGVDADHQRSAGRPRVPHGRGRPRHLLGRPVAVSPS